MLLMVLSSFIGSFGAVLLKSGATRLHRNISSFLLNHYLAGGVALFLLSSYFFILGMRQGELSILYPIVSLQYVWALFWSRLFFDEELTQTKFIGIGMIVTGTIIFVVAGSR
jgi:uncharacterized membrane protein